MSARIAGTTTAGAGWFRWTVALLLFLANAINDLDRSALSIVAPVGSRDLHLDAAQLGLVFGAFFVGYSLFCFVGGSVSDRFGPKLVFAVAMAWWSVLCSLTALATGFVSLLVLRVLFGLGEGLMGSTTNETISDWFLRREAGTTVGLTNAGNPISGAISDALFRRTGASIGARKAVLVGGLSLAAVSVFLASRATGVTGFIVEYGGGYGASFVLAAALALAGAVAVVLVVRSPRRMPDPVRPAIVGLGGETRQG